MFRAFNRYQDLLSSLIINRARCDFVRPTLKIGQIENDETKFSDILIFISATRFLPAMNFGYILGPIVSYCGKIVKKFYHYYFRRNKHFSAK